MKNTMIQKSVKLIEKVAKRNADSASSMWFFEEKVPEKLKANRKWSNRNR